MNQSWTLNQAKRDSIIYAATFGTYSKPAGSRYGNAMAAVTCDNCGRENLKRCFGHANCDVCLYCVDMIDREAYLENDSESEPDSDPDCIDYTACGFPGPKLNSGTNSNSQDRPGGFNSAACGSFGQRLFPSERK